jgi:thiamine phosphate synthase YjbQ (UPF0047 family)
MNPHHLKLMDLALALETRRGDFSHIVREVVRTLEAMGHEEGACLVCQQFPHREDCTLLRLSKSSVH